ncbi:hypothetical protein [Pseudarthrobacter sp. C4D7]|uniref:hypothetical protein n=1 Tax=Pseudarthrobacter sp. C4D7 TaxID=2735268 RepID=UPI0015849159|nr:hypothetical protein [Pseudarthrobacter sp. C4D7]NUT72293.1 hypothetical protein [Pseudarthrobacter sp. C4D7]
MRSKALPIVSAVTFMAASLVVAQPVQAADPVILDPGLGCGFELQIYSSGGNLHTKEFYDREGHLVRMISAGKGVLLTYTNLENGKSISFNTSGSVSNTTRNPDGTYTARASGHNGLIFFPSDMPAGPSTTQYTGTVVYNIEKDGTWTLVSTSGPAVNVCAALT